MATLVVEKLVTAEEFAAMPSMDDYELIEGRIVRMAPPPDPRHGECELILGAALLAYARTHNGRVSGGEASIITKRNPDTVRGADLLYISRARLTPGAFDAPLAIAPDLVVEVVSPGNTHVEILNKVGEYLDAGVTVVLIVQPKQRQVCAYRGIAEMQVFKASETLVVPDVLPGFSLAVAEIFAE